MAEQYETLTESLNACPSVQDRVHQYAPNLNREASRSVYQYSESIKSSESRELDNYEIDHGLSPKELRTLLKIIAREFPDCGRKRGAILRYIKAYIPEENTDNRKLYNILNET